jgi:DNA polymerase
VVLLGATAAHALIGPKARVTRDRGQVSSLPDLGTPAVVTIHPSAILRMDPAERDEGLGGLTDDLEVARACIDG